MKGPPVRHFPSDDRFLEFIGKIVKERRKKKEISNKLTLLETYILDDLS